MEPARARADRIAVAFGVEAEFDCTRRGDDRRIDRRGGGGRGAARAARVGGGLFNLERVPHVGCERHVGLARGAGDRQAAAAQAVALKPLVGVARRFVGPGAGRLGQRLALLGGTADRGWGAVRGGGGMTTTAATAAVAADVAL